MTVIPTPTFSIYKPNQLGEKVDTLQACHFERMKFSRNDLPANICAKDGFIYQTVWDCRIPAEAEEFEAIVSFQIHSYGKFAVIRIAKD